MNLTRHYKKLLLEAVRYAYKDSDTLEEARLTEIVKHLKTE